VSAETPELMHPAQTDRRPAIWPWLVMPLIALTAFYCLERLAPDARYQDDFGGSPVTAVHSAASSN
jgi:hypothetical protein